MQLRFYTPFDVCVDVGIITEDFKYYHDRFFLWRMSATRFLDAKSIELNKEQGKAIEQYDIDDQRNADKFNHILREMTKPETDLLRYICKPIKDGTDVRKMKENLFIIGHEITSAFDQLKKIIDKM